MENCLKKYMDFFLKIEKITNFDNKNEPNKKFTNY